MNKSTLWLAAVLAATLKVSAGPILEFDDVSIFGGTVAYSGNPGAPLTGTGIRYDIVRGVGTVPADTLTIVGGTLNFATGANISETANLDTFAGGGFFTLTGTVLRPDNSVLLSGVILSGSFTGNSVVLGLGGGNGLFSGVGIDAKNPELLAYFGIAPGTPFEFADTQIGFAAAGVQPNGGFSAAVIDADLTNTAQDIPFVPEGGSMFAMAGLGMTALVVARRSIKR